MPFLTHLLIALLISASSLAATEPPKLSAAEQQIVDASKTRTEAARNRDVAAWSHFVADDCLFSDDDGILYTKAQMMETYRKLPRDYDRSVDQRDFIVHLYGNTAVANSRGTTHEQFGDTDIVTEIRRTETYIKRDGVWLLVAVQWGALPINFRKPVVARPGAYQDYVGQYEWRPGDHRETVSVRDDKLWSELDGSVDEYLPLGSDTFFVKSDLGTSSFTRDAQGHVTGYTYHRADGQEVHVQKIK